MSAANQTVWEFKCTCGAELEVPASETDFSPTSLGLPECSSCGDRMHHVGPVLDECDSCGQDLLYRGTTVGSKSVCENCYERMEVML